SPRRSFIWLSPITRLLNYPITQLPNYSITQLPNRLWVHALAGRGVQGLAVASSGRGQRDGSGVHPLDAALRQRARDGDLLTDFQRVTPPAPPLQPVRWAHFEAPVGDFTGVLVFHVDVDPRVRIGPLDLCDDAGQRDRLLAIEFGCKRMMGGHASTSQQDTACDQATE